jgi:hypothetical protein
MRVALCSHTELPVRVERIDVASAELVQHRVAARIGERSNLLRERPMFAQRRRRDAGAFTDREERLDGVVNRDPCIDRRGHFRYWRRSNRR